MDCTVIFFLKLIFKVHVFKTYLTPMFTCSQKIYDVGMMTKFTKNFKFSSKVSVIIFWGILCKSNKHAFMFSFELN